MKIGFAQINTTVGDLPGNRDKILAAYDRLAAAGADLVLTPELAIAGYPPQDLVFKSRFVPQNFEVLQQLHEHVGRAALLVGFVDRNQGRGKPFHNAAALLEAGQPIRKTHKSLLPTYDVFDEDRYFEPARSVTPLSFRGQKIGVTICEDIWTEHYLPRPLYDVEPVRSLVEQGADLIVNLSASPFNLNKPAIRHEMVAALARTYRRSICYCNLVGGNDQLIFDGNSIALNANGEFIAQFAGFTEDEAIVDTDSTATMPFRQPETASDLFHASLVRPARLSRQMRIQIRRPRLERRHRFSRRRRGCRSCARPGKRRRRFDAESLFITRQHRRCTRALAQSRHQMFADSDRKRV